MAGVQVSGLAGLYVYFLLLATAWMAPNGVAAWLVPSEFMDVNYGTALKEFLANRVTLLTVHRFAPDDIQFGDALVSSVVLVLRNSVPPADHAIQFTYGHTIGEPEIREVVPLTRLRAIRKWTGYPVHVKNDRKVIPDCGGPTLGDLFQIRRGIATGHNKFFILTRFDARRLQLPSEYLRPILPSPRHLKDTIVRADVDGYPLVDDQLCVIDCDLSETTVRAKYPALWDYLQVADDLGVKKGYLVAKRNPWYKQERRVPAPFLCTYMGRGTADTKPFRFIWNQSRAIGTNLYLMLYPRPAMAKLLEECANCAARVHELLSQVTGAELRGEGRVYGGGLNKIEPRELGRISAAGFVEVWSDLKSSARCQGEFFKPGSD